MEQLKFDERFKRIMGKPAKYWKKVSQIPQHIKDFIMKNPIIIHDEKTSLYHCSKCFEILDENKYCNKCLIQYEIPKSKDSKYIIKKCNCEKNCYYYVFDIIDENIILYELSTPVCYPSEKNIKINKVYQIFSDGIENLMTNEYFSFEEYADQNMNVGEYNDVFKPPYTVSKYLYTDNLEDLKKIKLYKYTSIWELKDYFNKYYFDLDSLTINPIYYKQFEYLVKMKLYSLAAKKPNIVSCKKNFKEMFGVEKEYYQFMKEIDIKGYQLEALKIYPTKDLDLLHLISTHTYCSQYISQYVDLKKLRDYLIKQNLIDENIYEYYDYLYTCEKLGLDLKDANILFPKSLIEAHDKVAAEMMLANDPNIDKKIGDLSSILNLNNYEDDKYIIFPASNIASLIDESTQQSNCVRTYCERVSNNDCQIYFMRKKDNINKSFVTIEVKDGKVVQARTKFNKLPNEEITKILKSWEKQIILVENS